MGVTLAALTSPSPCRVGAAGGDRGASSSFSSFRPFFIISIFYLILFLIFFILLYPLINICISCYPAFLFYIYKYFRPCFFQPPSKVMQNHVCKNVFLFFFKKLNNSTTLMIFTLRQTLRYIKLISNVSLYCRLYIIYTTMHCRLYILRIVYTAIYCILYIMYYVHCNLSYIVYHILRILLGIVNVIAPKHRPKDPPNPLKNILIQRL